MITKFYARKICLIVTSMFVIVGCTMPNKVERLSRGGAEDLYELASMYSSGRNVKQDEYKSMHYLRLASERGSVGAKHILAMRYDSKGDLKNAEKLYKKIAEPQYHNGHAMLRLAKIYQNGELGEVDTDAALENYTNAAKLGYSEAMFEMAKIYEGKGQYKKAFIWYWVAEQGGVGMARSKAEVIGFKFKPMEVLELERKAHRLAKLYLHFY